MNARELEAVQRFVDLALSIIPARAFSDEPGCPCHWCRLRREHTRLREVAREVK